MSSYYQTDLLSNRTQPENLYAKFQENTKSDSGKKEQSASDGKKKDNIRGSI